MRRGECVWRSAQSAAHDGWTSARRAILLALVVCAGVIADENAARAGAPKEFGTAFAIDDRDEQLRVVSEIRRLLSIPNPPIDALVLARDGTDSGVLARLVRLASRGPDSIGGGFDSPLLQYEATWALTNVASGTSEHTRKVTASGAVPVLVRLLQRERLLSYEGGLVTLPEADGGAAGAAANADVREQAAWALGNVAGDSEEACRLVLEEGALAPLLALLEPGALPQTTRTAVWAASNFGRNCPKALLDDRYLPGDQPRSANWKALDLKIGAVAGGLADRFAQLAFSADEATAADASWGCGTCCRTTCSRSRSSSRSSCASRGSTRCRRATRTCRRSCARATASGRGATGGRRRSKTSRRATGTRRAGRSRCRARSRRRRAERPGAADGAAARAGGGRRL